MLEKLFSLSANTTSAKTEIIAGITTFLASMYIIVVNPFCSESVGYAV